MAKDKAPKKADGSKKGKKAAVSETAISVAGHPRATYSIRRAKGFGGLLGLVLVGWLSWRAGVLPVDAAIRALIGGITGYVACWMIAVQVWRHLVVAEARAAADRARERAAAAAVGS